MAGSPLSVRETAAGVVFRVRVVPRASRSGIAGIQDDALKLRIMAPPVEGKANEECIRLLAEMLGVKKGTGDDHRRPCLADENRRRGRVEGRPDRFPHRGSVRYLNGWMCSQGIH